MKIIPPLFSGLLLACLPVAGHAAEPASPWKEAQKGYLQASRSEHDANIKAWTEVAGWDFNEGATLPAEFKVFDGEWKVEKGSLWAYRGKPIGGERLIYKGLLLAAHVRDGKEDTFHGGLEVGLLDHAR